LEDRTPLRSVHTPIFPALLRRLGASLVGTTYQAGKLVLVWDEGDHLNTNLRAWLLLAVSDDEAPGPQKKSFRQGDPSSS
jgi:hypothetical protein